MFFVQVNIEQVLSVYSKDTDVFFILFALSELQISVNWSTEELIDLTLIASSLDDEKAKALPGFHALTGYGTVEKFTSKSKRPWSKHFL